MNFNLSYDGEPQFRCDCGSMVFHRYDPKNDARYKCNGCGMHWYGSVAKATPIPGSEEMNLKKRITRGICAADGCKEKDGLFAVGVVGRKDQVDVCQKHAMELPEGATIAQAPAATPVSAVAPALAEAPAEAPPAVVDTAPTPFVQLEMPATAPVAPNTDPGTITVSASVNQAELQAEVAEASEILVEVKKTKITTDEELKFWSEILADIKGRNNRLEAMKTSVTQPMNKAMQALRNLFRPAQDQLGAIELTIKQKIAEYYTEQAKRRAEATAALNDSATAEEVTVALETLEVTQKPEATGLQIREVWDFEIVDEKLLDRVYLMPNEKVIRAQIAMGVHEIAGLRIFKKPLVIQRAT